MRIYKLIYGFVALLLSGCSGRQTEDVALIAHAAGAIDGYTYTNTMEAAQKAADDGFKYIEFDLQMTSDSVLVTAHSWSEFNCMTGFEERGDSAPSYDDYLQRIVYERYTPATAADILAFFVQNPDLFFVTDKISDAKLLSRYFAPLKERMLVEAFSYDDYVELIDSGFLLPMYSCMADDVYEGVTKHLLFHELNDGPKIDWLVIDTSVYTYPFYKLLYRFCEFDVALFTVNDLKRIPSGYRSNVRYLYSDSIVRWSGTP